MTLGTPHPRFRISVLEVTGLTALVVLILLLLTLFGTVITRGVSGFFQTELLVAATEAEDLRTHVRNDLRLTFPAATTRRDRRQLNRLVSDVLPQHDGHGPLWVPLSAAADEAVKSRYTAIARLTDQQVNWLQTLADQGRLRQRFNTPFFRNADSQQGAVAGIGGALHGSFWALLTCFAFAFPIGIGAAVYLEEFAPRNALTSVLDITINNLAAVPSIIFGLLGLSMLLGTFGLPRSSPLVGGLVLGIMTLPILIVSTRATLRALPPTVREAAMGIGADPVQQVCDHLIPLAMPGILSGTVLGLSRALGETAPLLMIGMVAFIADKPSSPLDPATALPVQIYLWSANPEAGFAAKTAAAILVLLAILIVMNTIAAWLRRSMITGSQL